MKYIRTENDLNAYIKENNIDGDLNSYLEETLSYSYIGKFVSIDRNNISTTLKQGLGSRVESSFAISDEVIDLVVNEKILSDASIKDGETYSLDIPNMESYPKPFGDTIEMFAKTGKGVITDLIAINKGNFISKRFGIPAKQKEALK